MMLRPAAALFWVSLHFVGRTVAQLPTRTASSTSLCTVLTASDDPSRCCVLMLLDATFPGSGAVTTDVTDALNTWLDPQCTAIEVDMLNRSLDLDGVVARVRLVPHTLEAELMSQRMAVDAVGACSNGSLTLPCSKVIWLDDGVVTADDLDWEWLTVGITAVVLVALAFGWFGAQQHHYNLRKACTNYKASIPPTRRPGDHEESRVFSDTR
eukprot:NODE_4551_length_793_cov_21.802419_g4210_i0.p1 GENE.NODE_4551_length_793_cov_21.802419_g4210_i0~~NODE_4551_length_793_cov_21.802419_g4210_i0.p1  ORF type:complete len:211 (+),score=27.55 NODE_4551_length_793_cov_21.802419_g4210_i0:108-740(+)